MCGFFLILFLQSIPNHILGAPASSKTASAQQVNQLEGQLECERLLVETLETKQRTLLSQLEAVTSRETELREEVTMLEKNLTILKHDLKEVSMHFILKQSILYHIPHTPIIYDDLSPSTLYNALILLRQHVSLFISPSLGLQKSVI